MHCAVSCSSDTYFFKASWTLVHPLDINSNSNFPEAIPHLQESNPQCLALLIRSGKICGAARCYFRILGIRASPLISIPTGISLKQYHLRDSPPQVFNESHITILLARDEILLKKNLVDPSEHDGKDPDVIPPQNSYCAEMEQPGGIPNMLLPPNVGHKEQRDKAEYAYEEHVTVMSNSVHYIGPEDRANYRIEAVQEMPFDPVPPKSGLYEADSLEVFRETPKHRQEAYIDFCPNQPVVAPNICQYDANAVPFATLDYHRRPPQAMLGAGMPHPELEDERRTLPRGRSGMHNPNFHGSREILRGDFNVIPWRCIHPLVVEGQQFRRQCDERLFESKKRSQRSLDNF
ncbi:hypothetical protein CEXT_106781 [Caerostris extrusa]|uniref:Uncharacterized protein n=1 Tax=Caerostris extrusa TaxID=172846 RepID=A0AAV4SN27_CAEEX|nr:hypothetical protein CEXT_106781 [Caerostris extrusa]